MTGKRLLIGAVVMGVIVPLVLFFLLHLETLSQLFTIAATTFLTWGAADFLATILERPRVENITSREALQQWERHKTGAAAGAEAPTTASRSSSAGADQS